MEKIFIITPTLSGGGAEKIALNMVNSISDAGFDATLIVFNVRGQYKALLDNNIKVVDLGVSRTRYVFFKIMRLLRQEKPTHVLSVIRDSNIFVGLSLLLCKDTRVVFREANTMNGVEAMAPFKRFLYKNLMKLSYCRADKVIANSNYTKNDLLANRIVRSSKVTVIGNPVLPNNVSELSHAYVPTECWFEEPDLKVILNVGRLHPQKNHQMLLEAFSIAYKADKRLRLLILGEGGERENIELQAKALDINDVVKLVGFRLNPFPYYKNSDLFVLSSSWEGFGNVIVEALSCGTPVISTDCPGGPREILDNGRYGTLVPVNDVRAMANAMLNLLQEPDIGSTKEILIARSKCFSVDSIGKEYFKAMQ